MGAGALAQARGVRTASTGTGRGSGARAGGRQGGARHAVRGVVRFAAGRWTPWLGAARRSATRAQSSACRPLEPGLERWAGKVAVVTGASSGIGREVAARLAAAGLLVVGVARRVDSMVALEEAFPKNFVAEPCDVNDEQAVESLFASLPEPCSMLINAAGLGRYAPLLGAAEGDACPEGVTGAWRETIETNVLGTALVTKHATAHMRRHASANAADGLAAGHVVMMCSMSGHRVPGPGNSAGMYCASKFATRALAEGLRQEARASKLDLRVTCVSPGLVETDFVKTFYQSEEKAKERYSRYECLQPNDVADAVTMALAAPRRVDVSDILIRSTYDAGV